MKQSLAGIYLVNINNGNTRAIFEICSFMFYDSGRSCVFIVNYEQISHTLF